MKVDSRPTVAKEKNSNLSKRKGKEVVSFNESDTDTESDTDDETNPDGSSDDDMIQMMAMIVRSFKKMKFRR